MPQRRSLRIQWLSLAALLAFPAAAHAQAGSPCETITAAHLDGGTITAARTVAAGAFTPSESGGGDGPKLRFDALPAFCQVDATLTPSPGSSIRMEVWLPLAGWNGKLVEGGNGAFSPAFSYATMSKALAAGYAATSSDTGHRENSAEFVIGHPEQMIDLAYRAVHVNAVAAKAIVAAYYKAAVRAAFFMGCSTGGRQAYGEAQRYPGDFNGIVAGDPGINFTHQTGAELWTVKQVAADPASIMSKEKLAALHAAVIAACDTLDGVKDGVLENPRQCRFQPAALLCKGADGPNCLTPAQVDLADKIYQGPIGRDGKQIFPGLTRGTEPSWGFMLMRTEPLEYGLDAFRLIVMDDPNWKFQSFDVDRDVAYGDRKVGAMFSSYDPDLRHFFAHGGKLIGYHGYADPQTTALNSIAYYDKVVDRLGGLAAVQRAYRLFLVPGMGHCLGGTGTDTFDMLAAIDHWVATDQPPASIPAAREVDGKTVRTRPLCPYPQQAIYKGQGSTDAAASFRCGTVANAGKPLA